MNGRCVQRHAQSRSHAKHAIPRTPLPSAAAPTKQQREAQGQANGGMGNGLFAILLLNFAAFLGANVLHFRPLADLTLNHWAPQWWQVGWGAVWAGARAHPHTRVNAPCCRKQAAAGWHSASPPACDTVPRAPHPFPTPTCQQFVTATFMHANWQHLSGNAFALLVFGRMVEEEEGALGLWLTYLLSGVGGTVASYLTAPHTHTISLGASGAVFGLFMASASQGLLVSSCRQGPAAVLLFILGAAYVPGPNKVLPPSPSLRRWR